MIVFVGVNCFFFQRGGYGRGGNRKEGGGRDNYRRDNAGAGRGAPKQ